MLVYTDQQQPQTGQLVSAPAGRVSERDQGPYEQSDRKGTLRRVARVRDIGKHSVNLKPRIAILSEAKDLSVSMRFVVALLLRMTACMNQVD
jgi:hypothetical protein